MVHAKSLRIIGQALEAARVTIFELENYENYYVVWSDCMTEAGELILRNALNGNDGSSQNNRQATANRSFCFHSTDITRLDAQLQKKRRNHFSSQTQASKLMSQLLRTLGDHLDRTEARTFHVSWTPGSASIDYQTPDGQRDSINIHSWETGPAKFVSPRKVQ
jgi:hypothetical protein